MAKLSIIEARKIIWAINNVLACVRFRVYSAATDHWFGREQIQHGFSNSGGSKQQNGPRFEKNQSWLQRNRLRGYRKPRLTDEVGLAVTATEIIIFQKRFTARIIVDFTRMDDSLFSFGF